MTDTVYTIGHSTHSIETLIELLKRHCITAVCDVRSQPYSRMNPQFNREPLMATLRDSGIKYVFLGKELGARTDDKSCYQNGQVQYDLLAETTLFYRGLERVREGARSYRIALMCAEKEPLECHRTILVARKLFDEGIAVKHILGDGQVEDHESTIQRLLLRLKIPERDMFRSNEQIVREAYARQGNEIALREHASDDSSASQMAHPAASGVAE